MKIRAPGKLLVTGAYAVLDGAPAIVIAVNRYVYLDSIDGSIDTRELYDGDRKLGLGSSAAAAVARLALEAAASGEDITTTPIRERIFRRARSAHAAEQAGGSGVDIAACTFGGVLRYTIAGGPVSVTLPPGLVFKAFWSGTSARTSDLRAKVSSLAAEDPNRHAAAMAELAAGARSGAAAVQSGDAPALIAAANVAFEGLATLGDAAGANIVPEAFARLAVLARAEQAAFLPSGAGGGDIGLFIGTSLPSPAFMTAAENERFAALTVELDERGVCAC